MPRLTPARRMTSSASPSRSRASSVEKVLLTVGATARLAFGNCGSLGLARQPGSDRTNTAARAAVLVHILDLDGFARHPLRQGRRHEAVEVAVERIARAGRGDPRAQVLHQLIRLQDVGPDLVAPPDVRLGG